MSQNNIPGLVPDTESLIEQWIDSPVGPIRYYLDQDGKLLQDRRREDQVLTHRVEKLEHGQSQISKQLELNTALTKQIVDMLQGTRALVKLLSFMAPVSKWAITVGAAVLFFYALLKGKPTLPPITIFDGE